jgi:hypothetical protein
MKTSSPAFGGMEIARRAELFFLIVISRSGKTNLPLRALRLERAQRVGG